MSLDREVEDLVAEYGTKGNIGTKCATGVSEHLALIEALAAKGVSAERISMILREKKQSMLGSSSIRRHVARGCKCLR